MTQEKATMTNATHQTMQPKPPRRPSGIMTKKIGSTEYRIAYHFSQKNTESMNDIIIRLIKNEAI